MIFPPILNDVTDPTSPHVEKENNINYHDKAFEEAFVTDKMFFGSLEELTKCVDIYEHISQQRIKIFNSDNKRGFRHYKCMMHNNCSFFAKFGRIDTTLDITITKYNLQHTGNTRLERSEKDGRIWKQRKHQWIDDTIKQICNIKQDLPIPKDLCKASRRIQGTRMTYMQGWRGLSTSVNGKKNMKSHHFN